MAPLAGLVQQKGAGGTFLQTVSATRTGAKRTGDIMRTSLHRRIVVACRLDTLVSVSALLPAVSLHKNSYQLFLLATTSLRPVDRARDCHP